MLIYEALNKEVVESIPTGSRRVLDLGCGDGSLGAYIKSTGDKEITGITYSEQEAAIARTRLDKVVVADLNLVELEQYGKFDCIICSHVLEHLYEPGKLLKKITAQLSPEGVLVVALPNILHWKQRVKFFRGSFKYTEGGLMDKTHFRFFDWETANTLLVENGLEILQGKSSGAFPMPLMRKVLPGGMIKGIDAWACKTFPGLFGFQFVFSCKTK